MKFVPLILILWIRDIGAFQGWKKPGLKKKKPAQWVFLGFLGGFFWVGFKMPTLGLFDP